MPYAVLLVPPGNVPRSCIPPDRVHRKACLVPVDVVLSPTISPKLLIANAVLLSPPSNVPRSCIPFDRVHKNACLVPVAVLSIPNEQLILSMQLCPTT